MEQGCFLVIGPTQFRGHRTELLAVRCPAHEPVAVVDLLGQDGIFTYCVSWSDGAGLEFHTPITELSSTEHPLDAFNWPTQFLLDKILRHEQERPSTPPIHEDDRLRLRLCTVVTARHRGPLSATECDWLRRTFGLVAQGQSIY